MFTADQAFWLAVCVGVVGIGLGFLIAASFHRPRRPRHSVEEMADPRYNPALDRTERVVRDALSAEADALAAAMRGERTGQSQTVPAFAFQPSLFEEVA